MSDADILREARDAFDECESAERDNRKSFKEDLCFARMEKQWPDAVEKQRAREGRPCLTINKLGPVIRQVVNDARQNRPQIKVHPVDSSGDPETADVISGMIRNIEASSNADVAYDTAVDNAVSGGFGYWRIKIDYANELDPDGDPSKYDIGAFERDLSICRISNPLAVFGDPFSEAADSSDWNVAFVTEKVKKTRFKKLHPKAKATDWSSSQWVSLEGWHDADSVLLCEYWKRTETEKQIVGLDDGTVMLLDEFLKQKDAFAAQGVQPVTDPRPIKCHSVRQYLMTGNEILKATDWAGKYIPIVPVYGDEINVEGKRFFRSLIHGAVDAQRMFNYWRTTATELVALAPRVPFIGPKGAFKSDAQKWATANTHSHSFIEYDPVANASPPSREPFAGVPAGVIQEALNASDDIKAITGIYDASLGARSNETSGRAIMARQREGDVSTFHFIDNLSRSIRHTGRILIDLIPKVYSTERIVRIIGPDGKPEVRKINAEYEAPGDDGNPLVKIHDVRAGRYDLTVSSGPSFTSRREEAATQMIELIRAYPDAAPIIGDLLAKNLDWPGAEEIAERLEAMLPPQIKGENPEIEQVKQLAMQQIQEMAQQIADLGQKLQAVEADRSIDAQKVRVDEYKAATERAEKLGLGMTPDVVQQIVVATLQDLAATANALPDEGGPAQPTADAELEGAVI